MRYDRKKRIVKDKTNASSFVIHHSSFIIHYSLFIIHHSSGYTIKMTENRTVEKKNRKSRGRMPMFTHQHKKIERKEAMQQEVNDEGEMIATELLWLWLLLLLATAVSVIEEGEVTIVRGVMGGEGDNSEM